MYEITSQYQIKRKFLFSNLSLQQARKTKKSQKNKKIKPQHKQIFSKKNINKNKKPQNNNKLQRANNKLHTYLWACGTTYSPFQNCGIPNSQERVLFGWDEKVKSLLMVVWLGELKSERDKKFVVKIPFWDHS